MQAYHLQIKITKYVSCTSFLHWVLVFVLKLNANGIIIIIMAPKLDFVHRHD
jgi:hypothetical protein